jgi:hypothetical protein
MSVASMSGYLSEIPHPVNSIINVPSIATPTEWATGTLNPWVVDFPISTAGTYLLFGQIYGITDGANTNWFDRITGEIFTNNGIGGARTDIALLVQNGFEPYTSQGLIPNPAVLYNCSTLAVPIAPVKIVSNGNTVLNIELQGLIGETGGVPQEWLPVASNANNEGWLYLLRIA